MMQRWIHVVLCTCFALHLTVVAEEQQPEPVQDAERVVARVNGEAITLRQLEDELMRQEGVQTIEDLLRMQLDQVRWGDYQDEDMIVKVANIEIPRIILVNKLLEKHAADVRQEMIRARVVQHALEQEKIELNLALKQQMLERMRRKHRHDQDQQGDTRVTFDSLIQERYGKTAEEWIKDPAFAKLAGLYALLYRRTSIADQELKAYYEKHLRRYVAPEAYQISALVFPLVDEKSGQPLPADKRAHKARLAADSYKLIKSGKRSFDAVIRFYDADFKGDRGWVARDGKVEVQGVSDVPAAVMEAVFQHNYEAFPTVLGVIESAASLSIVQVRGYRPGGKPAFEQDREAVQRDYVDAHFDRHMGELIKRLDAQALVEYEGLLPVLQDRRSDMQAYLEERRKLLQQQQSPQK